ncbi:MAG: 30S ribosomal protein S18 [Calditrichaeota bacterium]|nr:MAG: 30S ribosomal protein S18 [Calditrichota bacterium]
MIKKRRICRFCEEGIKHVDYKNDKFLNRFLTEQGKIIPRRTSGNCATHQRMLAMAVKRARHMAIIPFVREINR